MVTSALRCSRRKALAAITAGIGMAALPVALSPRAATARPDTPPAGASPHTTYFNDGLMLDPSGTMAAYKRPRGYRGARASRHAGQSEQTWKVLA